MDDDIGSIICRLVTGPRYRREMTDLVRDCIADEIVKHLKLSNWRFHGGGPRRGIQQLGGGR
jgi:hypothetical protein